MTNTRHQEPAALRPVVSPLRPVVSPRQPIVSPEIIAPPCPGAAASLTPPRPGIACIAPPNPGLETVASDARPEVDRISPPDLDALALVLAIAVVALRR
ncbi:hypothetical protein WMF28_38660 [Sorangium sp. So ce590]|uniref:hypothetical protein n=1 Tax=Sorangium sp. So ce590 TaxID=3133317 RepID=UPI003F6111F4